MRNPSSSSSHNYSNSGSNKQKGKTIPCCSKVGIKKGPWTPEEDAILINYIKRQGEGQWRTLPERAGLLRCGKSCRLRWMNYLRPSIKHGPMAPDEEDLILRLHRLLGNRWSLIAGRIPGRTDNEIKNYWNTHLSKKLINKGINPRTHKHFDSENPNFSSSTHYPTCSKLALNSSAIIVCPTINPNHNPSCPCLEEGAEERNKSPKYDQCGNIRVHNFSEGLMEKPDHHQQENQNKEDQDAFSLFIDSLINNDDNNEFVNQVDQVLQSNHNHVVVDDHDNSAAVLPNFSSTSRSMNSSDIQIDALWEADEFTYAMETSSRAEENMALDFDNHPLN